MIDLIEVSDDPIFVCGPHKSGSSLLRNIFDGHEELFVIPIEMHFLVHAGFHVKYPYQKSIYDPEKFRGFFSNVLEWVERSEKSKDRHADSITRGKWDLGLLRTLLTNAPAVGDGTSLREMIDYAVKAIYLSLNPGAGKRRIRFVEKSVENSELVPVYQRQYKNASFVHLVRNPYSNLCSFRRYKTFKGRFPYIRSMVESLSIHFESINRNRNLLDRFICIRYEDLVREPRRAIDELVRQLDIPYSELLLTPTSLGTPWAGNSLTNKKAEGISAAYLDKWKEQLTGLERHLVSKRFAQVLADFDYEEYRGGGHWAKRSPGESLKVYRDNRLFLMGS